MSKHQHTPGPWKVGTCDDSIIWNQDETTAIASIEKSDAAKANARLMAGAPELLALLKEAQPCYCVHRCWGPPGAHHCPECLAMQAAIAKAEGRT